MDSGEKSKNIDGKIPSPVTKAKSEYFRLLDEWVMLQWNLVSISQPTAFLPLPELATTTSTTQSTTQAPRSNFPFSNSNERAEQIIRNHGGGYDVVISPLYKRFLAEVIDCVILFIFKILIFVIIMDFFDIQIGIDLDLNDLKDLKFLEEDYSTLLSLSSDFVLLEVITKVIVSCVYEAIFAAKFKATPGKLIMGIRILHAEAVYVLPMDQQNNQQGTGIRALIYPNPVNALTLSRAMFRSLAKNLLITLMFPVYFVLFFYKSNQLIYDLLVKTVVVDQESIRMVR